MSDAKETSPAKPVSWRAQAAQLAAIVAVVFVAKGAIAEPFYVPSGSMEPTLLIGDALVASKYPYGYGAASLPIAQGSAYELRLYEGRDRETRIRSVTVRHEP